MEGYAEKVGKDLQAILEKGLTAAFPTGGELLPWQKKND